MCFAPQCITCRQRNCSSTSGKFSLDRSFFVDQVPLVAAMSKVSLTFTVQHYPADSVKVQIPLDSMKYGNLKQSCLKQAVRKALNLKEESLGIFGIYSGQLGNLRELCPESYSVLHYTMDYCFQRLVSNREEELKVISNDERALELVFWEVKYYYETKKVYLRPRSEIRQNMEYQRQFTKLVMSSKVLMAKLTEEYLRNKPVPRFSNSSVFVEVVRRIPLHYMSYCCVIESCALQQTLDTDPPVKKGTRINVAIDSAKCIALDITGKQELATWDWELVNLVDPCKKLLPSYHSIYNVCFVSDDEPKPGLCFATKKYMLVYSISKHFQKRHRIYARR